jgi:hypothetical protein
MAGRWLGSAAPRQLCRETLARNAAGARSVCPSLLVCPAARLQRWRARAAVTICAPVQPAGRAARVVQTSARAALTGVGGQSGVRWWGRFRSEP